MVMDVTARQGIVTVTHLLKVVCDDDLYHEQRILTRAESLGARPELDTLVAKLFDSPETKEPKDKQGYLEFWFGRGKRFGKRFVRPGELGGDAAVAWVWLKRMVREWEAVIDFHGLFSPDGPSSGVLNILTNGEDEVVVDGWWRLRGPTISVAVPAGRHRVELVDRHLTREVDVGRDLTATVDFTE